jgi:replication factor C subunit 3/5
MYDRVIVQDVIKGIAQTQQIDANAKHQFKSKRNTSNFTI